jgi:TPR repeat protein
MSIKLNTLLMHAAGAGLTAVVRFHVDRGDELNSPDESGMTPLLLAASNGHREICSLLLNAGADAAHRNLAGHDAYELAVVAGHLEVALSLISHLSALHEVAEASVEVLAASDRAHLDDESSQSVATPRAAVFDPKATKTKRRNTGSGSRPTFEKGFQYYLKDQFKRADKVWRPLANNGDSNTQYWLGRMYEESGVFPQYKNEVIVWYKKSARQGDSHAAYSLGRLYQERHNQDDSYESLQSAVAWYRFAAQQGHKDAQIRLDDLSSSDLSGEEELASSVIDTYWMWNDEGTSLDEFRGGLDPHEEVPIRKNEKTTLEDYQDSADAGDVRAQYILGVMYEHGSGVKQDYSQALTFYRLSAEGDCADAQYSLGQMYLKGLGVEKNVEIAIDWFRKACENGLQGGCDIMRKIKR